ncbi:MAG TPA: EF-P lysine aminoacylase GenX [Myxococcales bacterium]|nr:EF-P lysine aminoacylase GenX [Myxococcales bacterium]
MALGRVLRIDGEIAQLGTPAGVISVHLDKPSITCGDLVRFQGDGTVELVAKNQNTQPLNQQGWWRLQQVLPNLKQRQQIIQAVRMWFLDQGFLEVDTPTLAHSPGLEVQLAAMETQVGGQSRYLITSPEYHMKRLLCAGVEKIFYLGRAYRDDERGTHHLPEFTMLEWYRAGADCKALQADVEALVALATGNHERRWQSMSVKSALSRWVPHSLEDLPGQDQDTVRQLVEFVEPRLAEMGAVFLTDYPAELASLARINPNDPTLSERFETYIDGIKLANGFGELTCAKEQRERFEQELAERKELGLPEYPIDERFLSALDSGMPDSAGIALGVDRLVMLALGATNLDQITAFPPYTRLQPGRWYRSA